MKMPKSRKSGQTAYAKKRDLPVNTDLKLIQTLDDFTRCAQCGKEETKDLKLLSCNNCRIVRYCSKECQVLAWPKHKEMCKIFYADSEEQLRAIRHLRKPEVLKQMSFAADMIRSGVYGYIEQCQDADPKLIKQIGLHLSGRRLYQGWNSQDSWDKIKWFMVGPEWKTIKGGDIIPALEIDYKNPISECIRWFWSQIRMSPVNGMLPSFAIMFLDNPYCLPICLYGYPQKIIMRKMTDGTEDFLLRKNFFLRCPYDDSSARRISRDPVFRNLNVNLMDFWKEMSASFPTFSSSSSSSTSSSISSTSSSSSLTSSSSSSSSSSSTSSLSSSTSSSSSSSSSSSTSSTSSEEKKHEAT